MKPTKLIRKGESITTRTVDGKTIQLLFKSEVMEGILVKLEPMSGFAGSYRHKGEEAHLVLEGEVEFVVEDETFLCREGDMLWHCSNLEHTIRNPGMAHATYLTILAPPSM